MRAAAVALASLLASSQAFADARSDAREKVVDKMEEIAKALGKSHDAGGADDAKSAVGELSDLKSLLAAYTKAAAGDDKSEDEAKAWTSLFPKVEAAVKLLPAMHAKAFLYEKAPAVCKQVSDAVKEQVADRLKDGNAAKLEELATSTAKQVKVAVDNVEKAKDEVEDGERRVKALSTSDRTWEPLVVAAERAAEAMYDHILKIQDDVEDGCKLLLLGPANPVVRAALDKLKKTAKTEAGTLEDTKDRWEAWQDEMKALGRSTEGSFEELRDLICEAEEDPVANFLLDATVKRESERHSKRLEAEADRLDDEVKEIHAIFLTLRETKLAKEAENRRLALHNAVEGRMRGYNHPKLRTLKEIGEKEHDAKQSDSGFCNFAEVTIPGKGARMDCVTVKSGSCVIIEIKPDRKGKGKTDALKEAGEYRNMVYALWDKGAGRKVFEGDKKMKAFLGCIDAKTGDLKIDIDSFTYKVCPDLSDFAIGAWPKD